MEPCGHTRARRRRARPSGVAARWRGYFPPSASRIAAAARPRQNGSAAQGDGALGLGFLGGGVLAGPRLRDDLTISRSDHLLADAGEGIAHSRADLSEFIVERGDTPRFSSLVSCGMSHGALYSRLLESRPRYGLDATGPHTGSAASGAGGSRPQTSSQCVQAPPGARVAVPGAWRISNDEGATDG
jgi:hypothetical protein